MENKTENKTELSEQEKQELLEKIVALKQLPGLEISLCGSWVWIGGDTKPNKDALKALGCWWAAKKKLWYWHLPVETKHYRRRKTKTMAEIEEKYGKQAI